ncbi:MAG TPA: hypothetical protein VMF89_14850, partial [Polyangiales bacterium]|nr:hypothetical protein [Polyangiales bacterium]
MANLSDRTRASGLLCCALIALLGCGDDTSPVAKNDAGADASATAPDAASLADDPSGEFLSEYAAAVCAMYEPCCDSEQLGYAANGCKEWFRKVTAAYFSGSFYPDAAATCLRELASAREADPERCKNEPSFDAATLRESCRQAFGATYSGGAEIGGSCLLAGDCSYDPAGPVICYGGMCVVDKRGNEGEGPCYVSGRSNDDEPLTQIVRCEARDGLYCHRAERVCKAQIALGEPCPYLNACTADATCSGGRCLALPGPDEPCLNAVRGAGGTCR